MEAAIKIENPEKKVYKDIHKKWNSNYISITNSTENRKIYFRIYKHKTWNNHGFGLKRVDSIVAKYNGFINRQNEQGVLFTADYFCHYKYKFVDGCHMSYELFSAIGVLWI